jgi:hypothetical protein
VFRKLASVTLLASAAISQAAIFNFSGMADDASGRTFSGKLTLNSATFWIGSTSHGVYDLDGFLSVQFDGSTYTHALTNGHVWNDLAVGSLFVDAVRVNAGNLQLDLQTEASRKKPRVLTSTEWPTALAPADWKDIRFEGPFSGTVTSFAAVPEPTGLLPLLVGAAALRRRKNR